MLTGLKPQNLYLTETRQGPALKVLDFGIAKAMQEGETATRLETGTSSTFHAFTPNYGAPEQFETNEYGGTGPWMDVYALGLILTELVIGQPAYSGDGLFELYKQATGEKRPTPRTKGATVSDAFEFLCSKALSTRRAERFQDAGELLTALDRCVEASERPSVPSSEQARETGPSRTIAVTQPAVTQPSTARTESGTMPAEAMPSAPRTEPGTIPAEAMGTRTEVAPPSQLPHREALRAEAGKEPDRVASGTGTKSGSPGQTRAAAEAVAAKPGAAAVPQEAGAQAPTEVSARREAPAAIPPGPVGRQGKAKPLALWMGGIGAAVGGVVALVWLGSGSGETQAPSGDEPAAQPASGATQASMVRIPAGSFMMGSEDGDTDEKPEHEVKWAFR